MLIRMIVILTAFPEVFLIAPFHSVKLNDKQQQGKKIELKFDRRKEKKPERND